MSFIAFLYRLLSAITSRYNECPLKAEKVKLKKFKT